MPISFTQLHFAQKEANEQKPVVICVVCGEQIAGYVVQCEHGYIMHEDSCMDLDDPCRRHSCAACQGDGYLTCTACHGSGGVHDAPCTPCGGTGKGEDCDCSNEEAP